MQDNELKSMLKNIDIPTPSKEAKERAMQAAMQSFEKNRKGFTEAIRPISNPTPWEQLIRSFTMRKAYAFAGSFAAVAVVLAITTTHYSTIMQPVTIPAIPDVPPGKPGSSELPPADVMPPKESESEAKTDQNVDGKSDKSVIAPVPDMSAPGMRKAEAVALAVSPADSKSKDGINSAAPGMQPSIAAASPPVVYDKAQTGERRANERYAPDAAAGISSVAKTLQAPGKIPQRTMAYDESSAIGQAAPGMPYNDIMPYPKPVPPVYYGGGDKFEHHASNEVKSVASEPVSTFSLDVDTASYSFVRRMINEGQLPQADMVRAEEMINYFDYSYALPENKNEPFKPSVTVAPAPWNANHKLVHIGIKGYDVTTKPRANLVFLIDVSGSMSSTDKLPLVKSSLKMLVDQMNPEDTIGIVTYAGYAGTALAPTKIANKQTIISVIDQLGAGGGTAGGEGIRTAYELAQQHMNKEGVNRVILATDGDFNVGITDPAQLTKFIEQKRETGVTLSILGFGKGNYNDSLMQKLAQNGNGNAAYIDNINEARKVLVQEAGSTLFTIAKDVKIQVEFNPATVSEYRLIGYESRMLKREDFNNDKIDAGEVGAGHAVTAIYEITPAGAVGTVDGLRYSTTPVEKAQIIGNNFSGEYGFLKMRYKLPNESESKLITTPINSAVEVSSIEQASADTRFATAVAAFAQLLKGSQYVSGYSMDSIATLADGARGMDKFGYRAEFVQLVNTAKSLQGGYMPPELLRNGCPEC